MLAIGSDHGGYELKEEIKKYLDEQKIPYKDFGTDSAASVDYPDIAYPVANVKKVFFAAVQVLVFQWQPTR